MKLNFVFVNNGKSYCTVGDPYSVGDKRMVDDVFNCEIGQFYNKAEIRQKIKILSANVFVEVNIDGQWCNESKCFNFGMLVPIVSTGKIKASGNPYKCDQE